MPLSYFAKQFLLHYKFSPNGLNEVDPQGTPPLIHGIDGNSELVVAELLNAGADHLFVSAGGNTPENADSNFRLCRTLAVNATALHAAAEQKTPIFSRLLAKDCSTIIDITQGAEEETALHIAVREGNLEYVRELLAAGADPRIANVDGFTALHMAVLTNRLDLVETLVDHPQVPINAQTHQGATALLLAAATGIDSITQALLKAPNARVELADAKGLTPIMAAAEQGHVSIITHLTRHILSHTRLETHAAANMVLDLCSKRVSTRIRSTLRFALEAYAEEHAELIKWQLQDSEHGFSPNEMTTTTVEKLTEHLSQLCTQDAGKHLAKVIAKKAADDRSKPEERKAPEEITNKDPRNYPDILFEIDSGDELKIARHLRLGANHLFVAQAQPKLQTLPERMAYADKEMMPDLEPGYTLLHNAVLYDSGILSQLLARDCSSIINQSSGESDTTPLHLAVREGKIHHVRALLAAGANPNPLCGKDLAALHYAVRQSRLDIVEALVAHPDIDPNVKTLKNVTPVLIAAGHGMQGIMGTLLAIPGIDVECADDSGLTPLATAARNGHITIIKQLLAHLLPKAKAYELNSASYVLDILADEKNSKVFKLALDFALVEFCQELAQGEYNEDKKLLSAQEVTDILGLFSTTPEGLALATSICQRALHPEQDTAFMPMYAAQRVTTPQDLERLTPEIDQTSSDTDVITPKVDASSPKAQMPPPS